MLEWLSLVQNSEQIKKFYPNIEILLNNLYCIQLGFYTEEKKAYFDFKVRDLNPVAKELEIEIKGVELDFMIGYSQIHKLQTFCNYEKMEGCLSITVENNSQRRIIFKNRDNDIIFDLSAEMIRLIRISDLPNPEDFW